MQDLEVLVRKTVFEMARVRGELEGKPVMSQSDDVKWALVDLLKLLDRVHGGMLHQELSRIAKTLGVELPLPPDVDEEVEV